MLARHCVAATDNRKGAIMAISIGIDVAEARKGLDLVALNDDRSLVVQRAHATVPRAGSLTLQELSVTVRLAAAASS